MTNTPSDRPSRDPQMQGEGNRTAARRYNKATTDFTRSGQVEQAARDAAPDSAAEAQELKQAERTGRSKARR